MKESILPLLNIPSSFFSIVEEHQSVDLFEVSILQNSRALLMARQWFFDFFFFSSCNSSLYVLGCFLREKEAHDHGNDSPEQKEILSYHCGL